MPVYKDFKKIFEEAKQVAINNNLTIEEIQENAKVDPQLLRVFFDDSKDVIDSLDRMFKFLKVSFSSRLKIFEAYKMYDSGTQIKLSRVIEPKCSIYYDKPTSKFYKFSYRVKTIDRSEFTTETLKSEMMDLIYKNLNNYVLGTYRSEIKNK